MVSVSRSARELETGKPPKVLPRVLSAQGLESTPYVLFSPPSLGVKFPGPFLVGNCAEKPIYCRCQFEGGAVRFSTESGGKIAENRTLTDVNRRYFGTNDRFSAVNRR